MEPINTNNTHDSDNHANPLPLLYLDTPIFDIKSLEIKGIIILLIIIIDCYY